MLGTLGEEEGTHGFAPKDGKLTQARSSVFSDPYLPGNMLLCQLRALHLAVQ